MIQRIICESEKKRQFSVCDLWGGKEKRWRERWLPNLLALRPSWDMGSQWLPNEPLLPQRTHPTPPPGVPNIRMKDCTHSITITCVAFPARSGGVHENTIFVNATATCSPFSHVVVLHRRVKTHACINTCTCTFKHLLVVCFVSPHHCHQICFTIKAQ